MSYISIEFLLFVIIAAILYYVIPKRFQWILLLVASYAFYMSGGWKLTAFLLFTTISTYFIARWCQRIRTSAEAQGNTKRSPALRWILILGLVLNFGMLGVLKYVNPMRGLPNLVLPLGISFYTFQSMGYLIDVYRGKYEAEKNIARFALFVSFFPQLLQGPIGRFDRLKYQYLKEHEFDLVRIQHALQRICWGYFKKLILADRAGVIVNAVFGDNWADYRGMTIVVAILMYSIQLYGDFSGGIDVALGVAELFDIRLDENFKRPYFAVSISDFWHRWHITLGTWMKDYVFYPISLSKWMNKWGKHLRKVFGKKNGRIIPVAVANLIVFFIVGVWHGAGWKYIVYGLYNGVIIAIENFLPPVKTKLETAGQKLLRGLRILGVFILVNISWYFDIPQDIRASFGTLANTFRDFSFRTLWDGTLNQFGFDWFDWTTLGFGVVTVFIVSILQERGVNIREAIDRRNWAVRWALYLIMLFALPMMGYLTTGGGAFIYAQF